MVSQSADRGNKDAKCARAIDSVAIVLMYTKATTVFNSITKARKDK